MPLANPRGPSYTFLIAAICAPVKQSWVSALPEHLGRSLPGSKLHRSGLSISPSFTPSIASHLS